MPKKGYKQTQEHKDKLRIAGENRILSKEHKENISIAMEGNTNSFINGVIFNKGVKNSTGNHKKEKNGNWKGGFTFFTKRGYGQHKISFEHPGCVWHHVNMMFMVACPEEIHNKCLHHVLGSSGIHAHFLEGVLG